MKKIISLTLCTFIFLFNISLAAEKSMLKKDPGVPPKVIEKSSNNNKGGKDIQKESRKGKEQSNGFEYPLNTFKK